MNWYAARSVYFFGMKSDKKYVYEERSICIEAVDFDSAHRKAQCENEKYASENNFIAHPEIYIYRQDGDDLVDNYELFSELFESTKKLDDFYKDRYLACKYIPDEYGIDEIE